MHMGRTQAEDRVPLRPGQPALRRGRRVRAVGIASVSVLKGLSKGETGMDLETQLLERPLLRSDVDEIGVASGQVLLEPPVLDIPEEPKSIAEERSSGLDGCIVGGDIAETRLALRAETVLSGSRGRPALVLVVGRDGEGARGSP